MPISRPQIVGGDRGRPNPAANVRPRVTPGIRQPPAVKAPVAPKPPIGVPALQAATPSPADPLGTSPEAVVSPMDDFARINAERLEAAMAAIEAQFGLTREQLLSEQSAIADEYKLLNAQAERAREQTIEQTVQGAQERGIVRSGIAAENVSNVELAFAEQLAQLESGRASVDESIESQLAALEQQEELARLEAERQAEQSALDLEILQLLANAGV